MQRHGRRPRWILMALLGGALAFASPALAQQAPEDNRGFYLGGYAGISWAEEQEAAVPIDSEIETGFDSTAAFGGTVGYGFGRFRVEGELGYRESDVDDFSIDEIPMPVTGQLEVITVTLNALVDFDVHRSVKPYVGAGAGIVDAERDVLYDEFRSVGDDQAFVWQAKAGIRVPFHEHIGLFVEGRYFDSSDLTFDRLTPFGDHEFDTDYSAVEAVGGFQVRF